MLFAVTIAFGLLGILLPYQSTSLAEGPAGAAAQQPFAKVTPAPVRKFENGIPIGTKITMANWTQYKDLMPDGMVELFKGTNFWKMPPDVEMNVGPTRIFPLPQGYPEATEKYGGQT